MISPCPAEAASTFAKRPRLRSLSIRRASKPWRMADMSVRQCHTKTNIVSRLSRDPDRQQKYDIIRFTCPRINVY
jgi:hypothetical protein